MLIIFSFAHNHIDAIITGCPVSKFKWTFVLGHKCTMKKLTSFGRIDDSDSDVQWPLVSSETVCRDRCLDRTDCDAFTYVTKEKKCIAHKKIISPKKGDCCTYWAKTCPGEKGTQS